MSFNGKVALVTGASSGIGAATAIAFAAEGARVAMVGRNRTKLNVTAEKCEQNGSKPLIIIADVSKSEDIERIMAETLAHFGRLDVLVNNAGVVKAASILAPNAMKIHEETMATNLQSAVHLSYLAAPHLIRTRGNIVNVSSAVSKAVILENSFSYLTSKAALDHFTRAIALELAPKGVRVNAVNPGAVRTDCLLSAGMLKEENEAAFEHMAEQAPLKRVGEPKEIADLILFLASDKAKSVTGSTYVSDNGTLLVGVMRYK